MATTKTTKNKLTPEQADKLLKTLKPRFEKNASRHKGIEWAKVQAKLEANADKLWSLNQMEATGGEPDVVGHDKKTGAYIFSIARPKPRPAAAAFATTAPRLMPVKSTSPKPAPWTWPPK